MSKYLSKEERKQQIKKATIELICQHGYRNTSVQKIVETINYSKGGFYNCYSSKEELFIDILEDGMKSRFQVMLDYKKMSTSSKNEYMMEILLDKMLDYNDHKKIFISLVIEKRHNKDLEALYQKMMKDFSKSFYTFCKMNGFEEYLAVTNEEFSTFINTIIIGTEMLGEYGNESYRNMLRDILNSYFKEINLYK